MKLTVTGLDALKKRLEKTLPEEIRENIGKAMVRGAERVVRGAQALVPTDSGHLKSTIGHTEPRVGKNGKLYVAITAGDVSTQVGQARNFQLARIVEFGAQGRAAEPFLMPAYRAQKRSIRAGISRAIKKAAQGQKG